MNAVCSQMNQFIAKVTTKLAPSEYKYFDENNKLQTKTLNIFQKFLRTAFGRFQETHLFTVAKKACQITLSTRPEEQKYANENAQQLLALIQKTDKYCSSIQVAHCVTQGKTYDISVNYHIVKDKQDENTLALQSINFDFKAKDQSLFSKIFFTGSALSIYIQKYQEKDLLTTLSTNVFLEEKEQHNSKEEFFKIFNNLLTDSHSQNVGKFYFTPPSTNKASDFQERTQYLQQRGWKLIKEKTQDLAGIHRDIYELTREASKTQEYLSITSMRNTPANPAPSQPFSLTFATKHLLPSTSPILADQTP